MGVHEDAFPYLDHFLAAYLHQDWDIFGKELDGVVARYVSETDPDTAHGLKADIKRFLMVEGNDVDAAFERVFRPDVLPSGWGMSTQEWLLWIDRLVARHLGLRSPGDTRPE